MKVTLFGTGYVGLVGGACLAESGNHVLCVDVNKDKIRILKEGGIPIYEPGLDEIVRKNVASGRLSFSTNPKEGVEFGTIQFIAVGTPPDEDGSADLTYVLDVAKTIGSNMSDYKIVVDKSTVPVGTADAVRDAIREELKKRKTDIPFDVVSNPEFLKEGSAVNDFMKPDRIIIGVESERAEKEMRRLYAPFGRSREKVIVMDIKSAELSKYAANSLLATKISFMNDIANLAEKLGANVESVRKGIGSDERIGHHFIYPGCGYGGSCFPKDVKALIKTAKDYRYKLRVLQSVEDVNDDQKTVLFQKISKHFGGKLKGKTFAIWGLSFKPNTDDMREAPSRVLMEALWKAGAKVRAYDPVAVHEAKRIYKKENKLFFADSPEDALVGADALVVVTEWQVFRSPDFDNIKSSLKQPVIFDGRNMYDPKYLQELGITYYSIGR